MALLIATCIYSYYKQNREFEAARLVAIEQMKADSIAAEKERLAAIEQARKDSIDKVMHQDFVTKMDNMGLILCTAKMTDGGDGHGVPAKGLELKIFNPTKKVIKYVEAFIVPVNKNGKIIPQSRTCRGEGPVASYDYGEWNFIGVFIDREHIINDFMVKFTAVYADGTKKSVKYQDAHVNFKESWFGD